MQEKSVIPYGDYCYNENGRCPYWIYKKITHDKKVPKRYRQIEEEEEVSVSIPYCLYLNKGDVFDISDEEFEELKYFHNCTDEELLSKYPLSLLWDAIKECGENEDA